MRTEQKFTPTFEIYQLTDLEVEGIDTQDYPDFCDSFISAGYVIESNDDVRELTQNELDYINDECPEVAQELAHESIQ
tara:strand:- start:2510 stop:2743 length:234 start_codon:yes stop_codon:yes gene_type:complete